MRKRKPLTSTFAKRAGTSGPPGFLFVRGKTGSFFLGRPYFYFL
ncbi:hypothetical protein EBI_27550 [Enterocytozoon bieneusi H348]|nr:hypothetical protein EBI_27550 [Enterocytozoon bieneusi H348]|eukprot:XP_002651332.1 hypothetical protein EBI_27550 [Enterocytozoon bieneusi H348]